MKKLFVLILIFSSFAAFAQKGSTSAPTSSSSGKYGRALDTWGLGVKAETAPGLQSFGVDFGYAINRSLSIGADFGMGTIGSTSTGGNSNNDGFFAYYLAPYAKYYLEPTTSNIFPFIKAQVAIGKNGANSNFTLFRGLAGAEWYPISTFAIGGGLSFLEFNTDNSQFQFGTLYPMLNLMWWM